MSHEDSCTVARPPYPGTWVTLLKGRCISCWWIVYYRCSGGRRGNRTHRPLSQPQISNLLQYHSGILPNSHHSSRLRVPGTRQSLGAVSSSACSHTLPPVLLFFTFPQEPFTSSSGKAPTVRTCRVGVLRISPTVLAYDDND